MADPISVRNTIVQTSMVEKIKQVQHQQGDIHQRHIAHPKADERERKMREVQTAQESTETKIMEKKEEERKGGKEGKKGESLSLSHRGDTPPEAAVKGDGTGKIIDIKV